MKLNFKLSARQLAKETNMSMLNNAKVVFSNVTKEDSFSQKFQIVVELTEDAAADAEQGGVQVKTKEYEGKTQYLATFKSKYPPAIVDSMAKAYDLKNQEIPRGSIVNVKHTFRDWVSPCKTKKGIGQDLSALQLVDLKESGSAGFEDVSGFAATTVTEDGADY